MRSCRDDTDTLTYLSPQVRNFAKLIGVPLARRHVFRRYVWDGETLGTFFYDRKSRGFLPISDHSILHELCHYVVAAPEQRDLPEYGLGSVYSMRNQTRKTVVVVGDPAAEFANNESERQEVLTQHLCMILGPLFNISPVFSETPDWSGGKCWKDYEEEKRKDFRGDSLSWEAFRLEAKEIAERLGYDN